MEDPAIALASGGRQEFTEIPFDWQTRRIGRDWPSRALTMVGRTRLDNLQRCIERVLVARVPGDLVETGVWRGGATILMRGVLKAYAITNRKVWVADSFAGVPPPRPRRYAADREMALHQLPFLSVPLAEVRRNFSRYGLLDAQVRFVKGRFDRTLPLAPIRRIAVLRLDGDLYESTVQALDYLYPKLSPGGFLIVDDYALRSCRQAVGDFRTKHGIRERIQRIDGIGAFWRKRPIASS